MFTWHVRTVIGAVALAALGSAASPALAGCTANGCKGPVEKVYSKTDGTTYVQIGGDRSVVDCTLSSGVYFTLSGTGAGDKGILAMVLMAQATGREIHLRIVNGSANCAVSYAVMEPG